MPIADSELNKSANAHLLRPASQTVHEALRAWRAVLGSYEWWWLIIDFDAGRFTAIRFDGLRELLSKGEVTMNTRLEDLPLRRENPADWDRPLPGVVMPKVVDQNTAGMASVQALLQNSPGRMVIVMNSGAFRGIISAGERTFAFADKPLLDMLDEFEGISAQPPTAPPPLSAPDDVPPPGPTDPPQP